MLTGLDAVVIERLVTGGILAAVAIAVAFGPEFRQALARLRQSHGAGPPVDRRRTPGLLNLRGASRTTRVSPCTAALLESRRGEVRHRRSVRPPAGRRAAPARVGGRLLPVHPSRIAGRPRSGRWSSRSGPAPCPDDQRRRVARAELPVPPPAPARAARPARPRRRAGGSHGALRERRLRSGARRSAARGTAGGRFLAARGKSAGGPVADAGHLRELHGPRGEAGARDPDRHRPLVRDHGQDASQRRHPAPLRHRPRLPKRRGSRPTTPSRSGGRASAFRCATSRPCWGRSIPASASSC